MRHAVTIQGRNHSSVRKRGRRAQSTLLAVACMTAGAFIAAHHPSSPTAAVFAFALLTIVARARPTMWLWLVPATLPVIGFAPWTGWLAFEECDLIVLAVAAGGYLHPALGERLDAPSSKPPALAPLVRLAVLVFVGSLVVSAWRGFVFAGTHGFDWFEGYREPLNSLRLAKPFAAALLLWPLWRAASSASPSLARNRLGLGLMLGLAGAALAALWERLAFADLLDFSSDYRTTALFWEMHVGGAAFDGFLALTVPFVLLGLQTGSRARFAIACSIAVLAAYACLTTFSRAVYLAIPIGAAITVGLVARERRAGAPRSDAHIVHLVASLITIAGFAACAAWIFPTSGYRGMIALLGVFAILVRLIYRAEPGVPRSWPIAAAVGALVSATAVAATAWLPKGAYFAYAVAWAATFALCSAPAARRSWLVGGYLGVVGAAAVVARHWGGDAALARALPVVAVLAIAGLAAIWMPGRSVLPARRQAALFGAFCVAAGAIGVASGGDYMGGRFETSESDLQGRVAHWREGIRMLNGPLDWTLGRGLGTFPALHALEHAGTDATGDYRWSDDGGTAHLVLTGGRHILGWGELLRVSQRIALPASPLVVHLRVRIEQAATLHLEVCEKHLLYNAGCDVAEVAVAATAGRWAAVQATLAGPVLGRGAWYAPRLIAFSVANASQGTRVDVTDLSLQGSDGQELLRNGDFVRRLAFWFPTSDRNHLPWHLKDIAVHVLFHQGAIGLALLAALVGGALWRVSFGAARADPLAPAVAGGLSAFLVVGLFDSLLDVPRVAFLFYVLILIGLTRERPPRSGSVATKPPAEGGITTTTTSQVAVRRSLGLD